VLVGGGGGGGTVLGWWGKKNLKENDAEVVEVLKSHLLEKGENSRIYGITLFKLIENL